MSWACDQKIDTQRSGAYWSQLYCRISGLCSDGRSSPATPRAGDDLPDEFMFTKFCDWIRKELEEELDQHWYVETNGIGVVEIYDSATAAG